MTLDDWAALNKDRDYHYELQEGVLVVSPLPSGWHEQAVYRLALQLGEQLPGWILVLGDEVLVKAGHPATVRVPDLVATRALSQSDRLNAKEVQLVVEVISPGSRDVDLDLKPLEYAEAGIPNYWVLDPDPPAPSITVHRLAGHEDRYVETPPVYVELLTLEPFPLRVDITALIDP